jgi:hypothetical protein
MYGGGVKEKRQGRFPKVHWRGWRTRGRVRTCVSARTLPQKYLRTARTEILYQCVSAASLQHVPINGKALKVQLFSTGRVRHG